MFVLYWLFSVLEAKTTEDIRKASEKIAKVLEEVHVMHFF